MAVLDDKESTPPILSCPECGTERDQPFCPDCNRDDRDSPDPSEWLQCPNCQAREFGGNVEQEEMPALILEGVRREFRFDCPNCSYEETIARYSGID